MLSVKYNPQNKKKFTVQIMMGVQRTWGYSLGYEISTQVEVD